MKLVRPLIMGTRPEWRVVGMLEKKLHASEGKLQRNFMLVKESCKKISFQCLCALQMKGCQSDDSFWGFILSNAAPTKTSSDFSNSLLRYSCLQKASRISAGGEFYKSFCGGRPNLDTPGPRHHFRGLGWFRV